MTQYHLEQLRMTGFMAFDRTVQFGRLNYVTGPNGAGKSQVGEAIRLLVTGKPSIVAGSVDDVMLLARPGVDAFEIAGQFGSGVVTERVLRRWTRDADTRRVSQTIVGSLPDGQPSGLFRRGANYSARRAVLQETLGAWAEQWDPLDLRAGGPKLRARLIRCLGGGAGLRVEDYLPPDAPEHLRPLDEQEEMIDIWAQGAIKRARARMKSRAERLEEATASAAALQLAGVVPADVQAIGGRLEQLRLELSLHDKLTAAQDAANRLATQLADARTRLGRLGDVLPLATAEAALERLVTDRAAAAGLEVARSTAQRAATEARAAEVKVAMALRVAAERMEMSPDALTAASAELVARRPARVLEVERLEGVLVGLVGVGTEARDRHADACDAVRALEAAGTHFAACPGCGLDLRAALRNDLARQIEIRDRLAGKYHEARQAVERVEDEVRAVQTLIDDGDAALPMIDRILAWQELRAAARAAEDAIPAVPAGAVTEAQVVVARSQVAAARAGVAVRADIDRLELEGEVARADVAARRSAITRSYSGVETEIETQQGLLQAAGAAAERVDDYAQAVSARKTLLAELHADREWVTRMEAAEGQVLRTIASAIEGPVSEIMGAKIQVSLVDARGEPDCRIKRDGVDMATLSVGERMLAGIAILRALGPTSGAAFRLLHIGGFESVDRQHRPLVWAALATAQQAGEIDQALVDGCPDIVEAPGFVNMIRL